MRRLILSAIALALLATNSDAALLGRLPATAGGSDYRAVYDTELDVTWLANGNLASTETFDVPDIGNGSDFADGAMHWSTAHTWIDALNTAGHLGVDNWRLPTTTQPDPACSNQGIAVFGADLVGSGFNCIASEMPHLFYELGGVNYYSIAFTHNDSFLLFSNVNPYGPVWSGTELWFNREGAWVFYPDGSQTNMDKAGRAYVWAVRDGDIAPVPAPGVAWLLASAFGLIARRALRSPRGAT
jgi:hypothetical protein